MSDKKEKKIKITEAKGRPMLNWVGKKPLDYVKGFPAQLIEVFNPSGKATLIEKLTFDKIKDNWQNLLFHGDNKEVLAFLLENGFRGKIDLIYIDPPFDSNADYIRKVKLRGKTLKEKISGEDYTIGEQIQYTDIWANDNYLQFLFERMIILKELLADHGNILIQMDHHRVHYVKCVMDEVFGEENFVNEIIWHKGREGGSSRSHSKNAAIPTEYQNILLYAKNKTKRYWDPPLGPYKVSTLSSIEKDSKGWFYSRGRMGRTPAPWELEQGSGLKTYVLDNPNLTKEEVIKLLTAPEAKYVEIGDVWNSDIVKLTRESDYPTEKPESLLKLIVNAGSDKNHIVLDCFIGSGTTAAVAQKTGRRWIGVDINKGSIQTTSKRLQRITSEQYETYSKESKQKKLKKEDESPRYFSFAHYKVNDYDLQLLRTEAIELAMQHIGIQRTKTDAFFEGTLGKNLVKMIDFNHPLTLLDIQLIQDELKKRPDENRNITVVCLGKELAVDPFIEDYNKKHPVNKIEVIELRTDKKYGKFLIHKPSEAKVDIKRKDDKVIVEIKGFISPSIIERLNDPDRLVKVKIPDYRSMIDYVLIDSDYDGKVFNITYSDVPEKKTDLVEGKYELDVSAKKRKIAVKIVDMLGEEALMIREV